MNLEDLKNIRKEKLLSHKRKKREYYLKNKLEKQGKNSKPKTVYDYSDDLNDLNFDFKIKEIIKQQKEHVDSRKEKIIKKISDYKEKKQEYYFLNKNKRLEYDKEYRENKKEELKEYRKKYYEKNRKKILEKQKEKRNSHKEN